MECKKYIFNVIALHKEEKCVLQLTATVCPVEVSLKLEMLNPSASGLLLHYVRCQPYQGKRIITLKCSVTPSV